MRTCLEIMEWFDAKWPESLACPWDNVGLLAGRAKKEVKKREKIHVQDDELKKLEALEKKERKSKLNDD